MQVKISDFSPSRVSLQFDGWPCKTIGHIFYGTQSLVHHFIARGGGGAQVGNRSTPGQVVVWHRKASSQDRVTAVLTHWGRVTHIYVGKLTIIDSDNGLSPGRRQTIIWTNAGILLIGPLGTNFNEILIGIQTFSFKKMHLKMASAKWRPFCLGLNVLIHWCIYALNHNELKSV